MLHFYDRAGLLAVLTQSLDIELIGLLQSRIANADRQGLLDMTEIVVIGSGDTEADLIEAIGFSPLVDLDGRRFGERGFCSPLAYAARVSLDYHEAIVVVGNSGFAFHLLIHDRADARLVALCQGQMT